MLFPTKDAWRRHLFEEHYSYEYWTCSICHEGLEFPDEESFVAHTKTLHASSIRQDRIAVLAGVSRRSAPVELKSCPICDWPQSEGATADKENLFEHVAKEVHAFSLRSLPWADKLETESDTRRGGNPENVINWLWGNEASENSSRLELTEPAGRSLAKPVTSFTGYFQHQDNPYFAGSSSPSSTERTSMALLNQDTERHRETLKGSLSFESNPSSPSERSQSGQQPLTPTRLEDDSVPINLSHLRSDHPVITLSAPGQPILTKRGRSDPLPGEKRAKVSNMRKIKACTRCHIRKREV